MNKFEALENRVVESVVSLAAATGAGKARALIRDVILPHHPDYIDPAVRLLALKRPEHYNVERLVEESLAYVGGYNFIDAAHADFDDAVNSDSKTSSFKMYVNARGYKIYSGKISSVLSDSGVEKTGALRITIYNPVTDSIMYYYLPKSEWSRMVYKTKKGSGCIDFSYNPNTDTIPKLELYRVASFKELATAMY